MNYDVNNNGYWFSKEQLDRHDAEIRASAIKNCIKIVNKTECSKFVESWKHLILNKLIMYFNK